MDNKIPYHCSFLLDPNSKDVKLSIAWRRVGNSDYGIYLSFEEKISFTCFKAEYSQRGELLSFLVADKYPEINIYWDADHLNGNIDLKIDEKSVTILTEMSKCFFDEWLESYGLETFNKILNKLVDFTAPKDQLIYAINGDIPLQIKRVKMPDILNVAVLTEKKYLYSFLPDSNVIEKNAKKLLESKMHLFLELI